MNLKGYQWLDSNKKVIMCFTFKYCELDIYDNITQSQFDEFTEFLKNNNCRIQKINYNNYTVQ